MNASDILVETPRPPVSAHHAAKGVLRGEIPGDPTNWLSERERDALAGLRDGTRRDDWLLGRWMAKKVYIVVASRLSNRLFPTPRLTHIEVLPDFVNSLPSRPRLVVNGVESEFGISISHSDRRVLAAIADRSLVRIGVDLVDGRSVNDGFLKLWFTAQEQDFLSTQRYFAMRFWGAKESSYKALQLGERFVPSALEVRVIDDDVWQCHYANQNTSCQVELTPVGRDSWAVVATALPTKSPH
ncbi:4'-phosphopantetheinyl transferase superfamily protein [Novipirellula aureliae]|uniref:4'-phosphopantetheinyl transferase superfamily protein n=1 Tax=Novipirellula aureliae TaxID=2527966 RepID=A0A5C6DA94_9BACT|nr:4'-phosphopantetheinyl transferase family protein [Novipirellula aureliae]TWU33638.1 4'-phosphopantetheinyl transferase superfamily protein [Novipirellula aureliae]